MSSTVPRQERRVAVLYRTKGSSANFICAYLQQYAPSLFSIKGRINMKWNLREDTVRISPRDMAIMSQCKVDICEIMSWGTKHAEVPPLQTILSYMLLWNNWDAGAHWWKEYRSVCLLAKERDQHYSLQYLSKKNGGVRTIAVPDADLYSHQRFIWHHILRFLPISDCAYAYRRGVSMKSCAIPHTNRETVIHLDIQDFFGSITENMVFCCLERETGYSKRLVDFLSRFCCYKGRLPQGTCTSPVLSNICFRDCDEEIQAYAQSQGLAYTRYSDDLYLSGNAVNVGEVIGVVREILRKYGFSLNQKKTKVLYRNMSQRVLGLIVNEKLQVNRGYRRSLRQELYYLRRYGADAEGAKNAPSYLQYLHQLQGKIAYVLYIDPSNEEFQKATEEICKLIGIIESRQYQDWLSQGNCGSFREWKLRSR